MKKTVSLLLLSLITFVTTQAQDCASAANIFTFNYNGHSYEVVKEVKSWNDAVDCAIERGGYLVEIGSLAEQEHIYDSIVHGANVALDYTSIGNGGGSAYIWIGASDTDTEGQWVWDGNHDGTSTLFWTGEGANGANDGAAVGGTYINWGGTAQGAANEPDDYGSGQDAGAICLTGWPAGTTMLGDTGEWNDIQATSLCYFVIEYDYLLGVNEPQETLPVVFPNPANNEAYIQLPDAYKGEIVIIHSSGKQVFSCVADENLLQIDMTEWASGIYFIVFTESSSNYYLLKL